MPTTEKQLAANRANAQKSTGPKTEIGKHTAARNAIKHGLYARDNVINSPHLKESQIEYDELMQGLTNELKPRGAFQRQLVHTIANCLWRQRRALTAETAHLNRELQSQSKLLDLDSPENFYTDENSWAADFPVCPSNDHKQDVTTLPEIPPGLKPETIAAARSIPTGHFCVSLLRYEMRLDIRLARAYKLLRHLQSTPHEKNKS